MQAGTRTERGERSRARILAAAAKVFAEQGYAGGSMARILAAAGVTKGGFYFHFASKQDLALAVLEDQMQRWWAETLAEASRTERAVDRLFAVPQILARQVVEGRGRATFGRLFADLCEVDAVRERVQDSIRPAIEATEQQFREAMDEGDLRADLDPRLLAELAVASFNGIQAVTDQLGDGRLVERVDALVAMVRAYTSAVPTHPATGAKRTERRKP